MEEQSNMADGVWSKAVRELAKKRERRLKVELNVSIMCILFYKTAASQI